MLFTFPSRYSSTIGLTGVFSLAGWSRLIHTGFLVSRATQDTAWPRRASHTGLSPAAVPLSRGFCSHSDVPRRDPTTPPVHRYTNGLGSSPVARHYWGNHCCFLLLRVLRCFSSPGSPPDKEHRDVRKNADGLSHSEIRGSTAICALPRLIAAYHVLHRLREPRHPPCALSYFRTGIRQRTEPLPDKGSGRNGRSRSYFQLYCLVDSI